MAARDIVVVLTAAGRSQRFGSGKKEFVRVGGRSVLDLALSAFLELPGLRALVITAPQDSLDETLNALSPESRDRLGPRLSIVAGGASRRDSVRAGLEALAGRLGPEDSPLVLVHDGARPWVDPSLLERVIVAAQAQGAAIPLVPLTDTPKEKSPEGLITAHPPRASLGGAQTPQAFEFWPLLDYHRKAGAEGLECTDDAELWAAYGSPVAWVEGTVENRKITYKTDLGEGPGTQLRIGQGWDLHRLGPERRLMLGGVAVPSDLGELAHSDGDVLLHAVIDALLGGAALGDIGSHFPPSDGRWKDADSRELTRAVVALVSEAGYRPVNLDCTVVLERPKLGPHREAIRASLAAILGLDLDRVSFKAKTSEGVNATGQGLAIEAQAAVLLEKA